MYDNSTLCVLHCWNCRSTSLYSVTVWLTFLWLRSFPQDHILQVSDWAFVAALSSSGSYSTGIWLGFCGRPHFLTIIFYRYLTEHLRLSSIPRDHILQVSDWAFVAVLISSRSYSTGIWLGFCGCPHFLTIIFYRYLTGLLWLASVPQSHILQVSDWEFLAFLSSSGSYSKGVWFSFLWLYSVLQDHFLQVSEFFCACPQFLPQAHILLGSDWAFCGSPQYRRAKAWTILKIRNHKQDFGRFSPVFVVTDCQFRVIQGTNGQITLSTRIKGTGYIFYYQWPFL